ncbi:MAG: PIN domain-containing protein [Anaerolineales bacterium]
MPSILLDTNILIYTFDPRDEARQEQAIAILLKLEAEEKGCLSTQCLSEFAGAARTKLDLSADEIMDKIGDWQNAFPVFNVTPQIVLEATRGVRDHKLSFYDSQIWASARLNQVPVIFTEDFQDGQTLEGIRFINPFAGSFVIDEW